MPGWLVTSSFASLSCSLVLTATYLYLYQREKQRFMAIWAFGWAVYALRFIFVLFLTKDLGGAAEVLLMMVNQLSALVSGVSLIAGLCVFSEKAFARTWYFVSAGFGIWIVIATTGSISFFLLSLPTYLFLGVIYVRMGVIIYKHFSEVLFGKYSMSIVFILWGIHKIAYPFLRPVAWLAPWGYLIETVLAICAALALLLTYFQTTGEALVISEDRYRSAFEKAGIGMALIGLDGMLLQVNAALCELLGYTRGELLFSSLKDITHQDDYAADAESIRQTIDGHVDSFSVERRYIHKLGHTVWAKVTASLIRESTNLPLYFIAQVQNITVARMAESGQRDSEIKLRLLIEQAPVGIALIDETGQYLYLNSKFVELFGYTLEDIPTGRHWFDKAFPDAEYRKEAISNWKSDQPANGSGESRPRSFLVKCKDGIEKTIHFRPVTLDSGDQLVFYEDHSELMRLEYELFRAQKIESLGVLAGGIAHDFNNVLEVILGYVSPLKLNNDISQIHENLAEAEEAIVRGQQLATRLLTFSKGESPKKKLTDIRHIINEAVRFALNGSSVRCQTTYPEDLWAIKVDERQISQVFNNLLTNALHAMPGGGNISISCLEREIKAADLLPLEAGRYIEIKVADTGAGVPEHAVGDIFDPYISTKEPSGGLGLAVTHSIQAVPQRSEWRPPPCSVLVTSRES